MIDVCRDGVWVLVLLRISNVYTSNSSYYTLLLIPIGALFYLAIRRLSDISVVNGRIRISMSERLRNSRLQRVSNKLFRQAMEHARQLDDMTLAVEGMAMRLGELTKIMSDESGKPLRESEVYKMIGNAIGTRYSYVAAMHRDLICVSDAPYREVSARVLYERQLNDGSLRIKRKAGVEEFLERSRIVCYSDLSLELLQRYTKKDCVGISALNSTEFEALKNSEGLYCKGNALLLFLELSKRAGLVVC
jgi:hypothetical protein